MKGFFHTLYIFIKKKLYIVLFCFVFSTGFTVGFFAKKNFKRSENEAFA